MFGSFRLNITIIGQGDEPIIGGNFFCSAEHEGIALLFGHNIISVNNEIASIAYVPTTIPTNSKEGHRKICCKGAAIYRKRIRRYSNPCI